MGVERTVEVVHPEYGPPRTMRLELVLGSLAALKLELAEAAMAWRDYHRLPILEFDFKEAARRQDALDRAEAAVQNHPDYRAADAAKGEKDG